MAAPAYEYEACRNLYVNGVLAYVEGDLVPAQVVADQGWDVPVERGSDALVTKRDVPEGAQAPADTRVDDDSSGEPPIGATDDDSTKTKRSR